MEITQENKTRAEDIAEIAFQLHRSFLVDVSTEVGKGNVSIQQYMLLGFLSNSPGITMSKLAAMMQHTTPATTGLVDRLVDAGLVERFGNDQDRRQVLVRITNKGKSLVDRIKGNVVERVLTIAKELSSEEFETWVRIYKIMQNRFAPIAEPKK